MTNLPPSRVTPPRPPDQRVALRKAASKLEAAFLAEMLKSAGLGEVRSEFGGGPGEEHFASFLRQAQAEAMVARGGIGLSESLFQSLLRREKDG